MTCRPRARRPSPHVPLGAGALSAFALLFVLAACGDSTGPLLGTRITIAVDLIDGPIMFEDVPGEPRIRCAVTFRATASGGDAATWSSATFKFYAGPNRAAPLDSAVIPASEIRDSWGGDALRDGQSAESQWLFESGAPFVVTADYQYLARPGASASHASVRVPCGPELSPTSPLPTITGLTVAGPADGLEPGDNLFVKYTANSPLGIWATAIELSGACEKFVEFSERLTTTASRNRPVEVPADCVLDAPLYVTVYAADAALRITSGATPGPQLVDHTPPTLSINLINPYGILNDLGAIYFVGDSIDMWAWASDNHVVRSIVHEVLPSGVRDSTFAPFDGRLRVPLRPEMTGSIQLRLYARDVAGLTSPVIVTRPDSIHVYPTVDRPTFRTSFAGSRVEDIVIDAERGAIYVLQLSEPRIHVLSATTLQTTRTIELPATPRSLDFTPGGDSLIVTDWMGLSVKVIDLSQPTPVLSEIPLTLDASVNQRAARVVVLANGKAFVALSGNGLQSLRLMELDLATGEQRVRSDAGDASGVVDATGMQRSPDRQAVVFGRLHRYDATTDQFTSGGNITPTGGMLSLDRGARHISLGRNIYDASLTFMRHVESIWGNATLVAATAISADGEYLYVGGARGVTRSRVSDGRMVDRTLSPIPAGLIRVASDDSFVVVAPNLGAAEVSLIRMQ